MTLQQSHVLFLIVLVIEPSITVKCHTMLLNSGMLKDLNNLQTIHQIAKKCLLKSGNFVSDSL